MVWFITLALLALLMSVSDKMWDNPLTIFGLIPVGFSLWLCVAVVVKAFSLS